MCLDVCCQHSAHENCVLLGTISHHIFNSPLQYSLGHLLWGNLSLHHLGQCLGRFLDIFGQDPSVSKSNRLQATSFEVSLLI